jgi:hypothetical protein
MLNQHPITPPPELRREWYGSEDCPDGANARRPKPPSLKEQALKALDHICVNHSKATDHEYTIRCALEALPE